MSTIIETTNKISGEVVAFDVNNLDEMVKAWRYAQELEKMSKRIRDKVKPLVDELIETSTSEVSGGYQFRVSNIQRKTYDKSVMRQVLDEDTFDVFVKPDKSAVDKYIKENLETLGDTAKQLRDSMIDDGKPYIVYKLERVLNDES